VREFAELVKNFFSTKLTLQIYAIIMKLSKSAFPQYFKVDTVLGVGLPYMASAFDIFLLRQTFMSIPKELEEATRIEGCKLFGIFLRVYVPLAKHTSLAYGLVSVSYHWNNFLWPLVITNSVNTRPLTVGLAIFGALELGVNWSIISAATLLSVSPITIRFYIVSETIYSIIYVCWN
jgi:sn-glycerol 3-phosphate transport system permease protein